MLCRRGMRDSHCQASLCTAYYQGAQCNRLCRTRAEPSAALNGYDGTALFHHAAYAASYTARVATWQATPLATSGIVPDKAAPGHEEREIPFACNAIMYEQYVILYYIVGPTCRGPNSHVRASLEI